MIDPRNTLSVRIGPWFTVAQIAQMCRELSTPETEVYCHIESIAGEPCAYFLTAPSRGAAIKRQAG